MMDGPTVVEQVRTVCMESTKPAVCEAEEQRKAQALDKKASSIKTKRDVTTNDNHEIAELAKESISAKTRKRTKTGCLTCRKRRIKCGEERPTCGNCVKSKRNCEGYTPRVIFKDPLHVYRPTVGAPNANGKHYQNMSSQGAHGGPYARASVGSASQAILAPIAPRPSPPLLQSGVGITQPLDAQGVPLDQYGLFGYSFDGQTFADSDLPPRMRQDPVQPGNVYEKRRSMPGTGIIPQPGFDLYQITKQQHRSLGDSDSGIDIGYLGNPSAWSYSSTSSAAPPLAAAFPNLPITGIYPTADDQAPHRPIGSLPQALLSPQSDQQFPECWPNATPDSYQNPQWASLGLHENQLQFSPEARREHINSINPTAYHGFQGVAQESDNNSSTGLYHPGPTINSDLEWYPQPSYVHRGSFHKEPEDDYWDVNSDEEMAVPNDRISEAIPADLGLMIAMSANQHGKSFRSLTNFLNEANVLSSYRPTYAASPLRDPLTALVFCHFITATAPTISASERRTVNSAAMFSGLPTPKSQQALWTYTMPMLALHHQGLLHAMLALASLHIAKLQRGSPTPSLKHYHFALRKVAKSLGNPTKRNLVATLGATLLLGFYEVTTAEHNKWNSHLAGAKQLIMGIDFVGMANRIRAHKAQAKAYKQKLPFNPYSNDFAQPYSQQYQNYDDSANSEELDENLISVFMGWQISYNEYGQIMDGNEHPTTSSNKPVTQNEIDDFNAKVDLFWWYAKQDMIQSIVSGNRLLLPYERWSYVPPRSPVGRLDAVHGTMDHLLLLIARIADFAGKDRPRKQKMFATRTQQPARMGYSLEPSINSQTPHGVPPSNYPIPPEAQYTAIPTNQSPVLETDLPTATLAAEAEWLEITRALDTFEEALGPSFAALSPEHMPPLSTPFGPALYYRTYHIACIWSLYYTGRIISTRVHPSMPPAAMVAAGLAAATTAPWANTIGRINAGIQPLSTSVPLNPLHGAALMDATMGLFHAGVQYRDAGQRGWTITKLRDVARMTGWQTSALIASGCERAWMRMHELGKGPPWEWTMNRAAKDDRVAGRRPDWEQGPAKDNNDRRFIHVNPGTRVYWALGILSVEEDMRRLELGS